MNQCNLKCRFCNADYEMKHSDTVMTRETIDSVVSLVEEWDTRAICLGGGGESLLNPNAVYAIEQLKKINVPVGVVTNGTTLNKFVDIIPTLQWVGISIDAATADTYQIMKGVPGAVFEKVCDNIRLITRKGTEISFKFLIHPSNYKEIYQAAKLAKELGMNLIHFRPGDDPWFDRRKEFGFTEEMVKEAKAQIEKARTELEDDTFKIFGVMHKFAMDWTPKKTFSKCHAIFTTCYISPTGNVGLCCDRRGDKALELGPVKDMPKLWGSEKHKALIDTICVDKCPRCTYSHVNEIFENVILEDKMLYYFI